MKVNQKEKTIAKLVVLFFVERVQKNHYLMEKLFHFMEQRHGVLKLHNLDVRDPFWTTNTSPFVNYWPRLTDKTENIFLCFLIYPVFLQIIIPALKVIVLLSAVLIIYGSALDDVKEKVYIFVAVLLSKNR